PPPSWRLRCHWPPRATCPRPRPTCATGGGEASTRARTSAWSSAGRRSGSSAWGGSAAATRSWWREWRARAPTRAEPARPTPQAGLVRPSAAGSRPTCLPAAGVVAGGGAGVAGAGALQQADALFAGGAELAAVELGRVRGRGVGARRGGGQRPAGGAVARAAG